MVPDEQKNLLVQVTAEVSQEDQEEDHDQVKDLPSYIKNEVNRQDL